MTEELQSRAPTFYAILNICAAVKRQIRSTTGGQKKRTYRPSTTAVIGVCASIFLHNCNQQMNALQHLVSLILHGGHAGKQVRYIILNNIIY